MKGLRTRFRISGALLSSIAGISVVLTAVKGFQSWKSSRQSSCIDSKSMSCSSSCLQQHKLGLLLADFDQTCTTCDTTELYYRTSQRYQNGSLEEKLRLDEKWKKVTGKYLKEYRDQISKSLSKFMQNPPIEFDKEGLTSFLKEIAEFNRKATVEVDDSKLIANADRTGLKWAAGQVKFYPGCSDVIKSVLPYVRIVSVNWSAEMIYYAFKEIIPEKYIYANNLLDNNGLSSGLIGKDMISSFDKVKLVQDIIAEDKIDGVSIFVGDSITDLLSMLATDLGIIVGDSKTILQVAKIFGIHVKPLEQLLYQEELSFKCREVGNKKPVLYSAANWFEIQKLLHRLITTDKV
ncbi:uncharacterized protein LOC135691659 isoform X1 [Rhopilema esculentum]|uniref:uncharacterized protein LOC135691659 isoform X1 n=1 Tax=Rhopilema esculentum TaxID=499914 RepID=UPI0031DC415F